MRKIIRYEKSDKDSEDAVLFYADEASEFVANEFVSEIERIIKFIAQNPDIGSRRYSHFLPGNRLRFWPGDRFPYMVFYTFDADSVHILRVLHGNRDLSSRLFRPRRYE